MTKSPNLYTRSMLIHAFITLKPISVYIYISSSIQYHQHPIGEHYYKSIFCFTSLSVFSFIIYLISVIYSILYFDDDAPFGKCGLLKQATQQLFKPQLVPQSLSNLDKAPRIAYRSVSM
jgi:hypothetical protein